MCIKSPEKKCKCCHNKDGESTTNVLIKIKRKDGKEVTVRSATIAKHK